MEYDIKSKRKIKQDFAHVGSYLKLVYSAYNDIYSIFERIT